MYATAILQAMMDLKSFRQKHGELQGTPGDLLELNSRAEFSESQDLLLAGIMYTAVLLTFWTLISTKRRNSRNDLTGNVCARKTPSWLLGFTACYISAQLLGREIFGWVRNDFALGTVLFCLVENVNFRMGE